MELFGVLEWAIVGFGGGVVVFGCWLFFSASITTLAFGGKYRQGLLRKSMDFQRNLYS